jgi:hypothetical protein
MHSDFFRTLANFGDKHPIFCVSFAVVSLTLTGWFEYRQSSKSSAYIWTWAAAGVFFLYLVCLSVKGLFSAIAGN